MSKKRQKDAKHVVFNTKFEDIKITTKTKIINTNWHIDIDKLYDNCKIKEITPSSDIKPFFGLNNGTIVYITHGSKNKGVKPSLKKKAGGASFLNNLTVIMWVRGDDIVDSKFVNFKISRSGKFQITGCKKRMHAVNVAKSIWKILMSISGIMEENIMKLSTSLWENPVAVIRTDLINIDFVVGYKIDRKKVNGFVKTEFPHFISILEISHGYTGVNIKIPAKEPDDRLYRVLEWDTPTVPKVQEGGIDDFYSLMSEEDVKKHRNKQRYITLLIFQSGSVIISGSFIEGVKDAYEWVKDTFKDNRFIEEV
jgi:hypothetical protein